MKPRNAVVKIHHKRKYPYAMSCDGNTPIYETVEEIEVDGREPADARVNQE